MSVTSAPRGRVRVARSAGSGPSSRAPWRLQADQAGRARRRALGGLAVVEAGQDPGRLASRCTAGPGPRVGRDRRCPARRSSTSSRAESRRHVVEELPVDHHDRRVVAGGVALEVLEGDLAVRRWSRRCRRRGARASSARIWSPPMTAHSVLVHTPDVVLADRAGACTWCRSSTTAGDLGLGQPEHRGAERRCRRRRRSRPRTAPGAAAAAAPTAAAGSGR